jgi:alkane 1-monooxygenase
LFNFTGHSGKFGYARPWLMLIPLIIWVGIYILDFGLKFDIDKTEKDEKQFSNRILCITCVVYFLNILTFLLAVSSANFLRFQIFNLGDFISFIVLIIINGLSTGLGFSAVGHEMIHRNDKNLKNLGIAMLFMVGYSHHLIEHIQGHHKKVATIIDHSTARVNQSFLDYFWNNNLIGEFQEALRIEVDRFAKKNLPVYSFQNFVVRYTFLYICFLVLVLTIGGQLAFFSFLGVVLIAKIFHTGIVYSQHYGLSRELDDRVDTTHSWQTNSKITEYLVLGFGNHSEHHTKVTKTYLEINNQENAPMMPFGYFAAGIIALFPYAWFNRVNPILAEFKTKN